MISENLLKIQNKELEELELLNKKLKNNRIKLNQKAEAEVQLINNEVRKLETEIQAYNKENRGLFKSISDLIAIIPSEIK